LNYFSFFWKALKVRKIKISHSWLAVNRQNLSFFSEVMKFWSVLFLWKALKNTKCQNLAFMTCCKSSESFLLLGGYEVLKSLFFLKSPQNIRGQNLVFIACCKLSESLLFFKGYEVLKCFNFSKNSQNIKCQDLVFINWCKSSKSLLFSKVMKFWSVLFPLKALKIRDVKISHSWLAVNCQNLFFFLGSYEVLKCFSLFAKLSKDKVSKSRIHKLM